MRTPSYALAIADELAEQGVKPTAACCASACSAPNPGARRCAARSRRAGIDAIDIYGLSEIIGPGVACECHRAKDGLHVWEDHFCPEIVDPETRRAVLPDGEDGELVITTLTKEALP